MKQPTETCQAQRQEDTITDGGEPALREKWQRRRKLQEDMIIAQEPKPQIKAKNQKPKHRDSKAVQTGNKVSIKTVQ